ncbi:MAG: EamA family transporter [Candidatus Aenigmarchaeota archaeon]|nr:EamA family transporter [Candidatus Aenigmarchaeota archaeon]
MKNEALVVTATLFTAVAQLSFKLGANAQGFYIGPFPVNVIVIAGFLAYGIAALLFLHALRDGQLSVLYPIWSLSFVWVFLASSMLLKETVTLLNWFGIILIMAGVSLAGRGAKNG